MSEEYCPVKFYQLSNTGFLWVLGLPPAVTLDPFKTALTGPMERALTEI